MPSFDARVDLTLIPFYGGVSRDTNPHAAPDHKLSWLESTLENAREFSDRIIVGVCRDDDLKSVSEFREIGSVMFQNIDPLFLPANLNRHAQAFASGTICYVEADSFIETRLTPFSKIIALIQEKPERHYVVPHVLNDLPENRFVCKHQGWCCFRSGRIYGVSNAPEETIHHREWHHRGDFYRVPDLGTWTSVIESFAGCFVCHGDLFKKVHFGDTTPDPLEHAGGIDIFKTGKCFKTYRMNDFVRLNIGGNIEHINQCGRLPIDPLRVVPY